MLKRKNFTAIATVSKQSELIQDYGLILGDGNAAKAAEVYLTMVNALNPRYGTGFSASSPTYQLVEEVTTGTEGMNQVKYARALSGILVGASLRTIEKPDSSKNDLVEKMMADMKTNSLEKHANVAMELAVPDRRARALGIHLPRLQSNDNVKLYFNDVLTEIKKLADSDVYAKNSDIETIGKHMTRLDAMFSLDNKDIHNRFHTDKFVNELLKDRKDIMIAENVKTVTAIAMALYATTEALKLRARAQLFLRKPILDKLIKYYDTAHPIYLGEKAVLLSSQFETILKTIIDVPMGPMTAAVIKHFEPSRVNTILGDYDISYLDKALSTLFTFGDDNKNVHGTTIGSKTDDGDITSYETQLESFVMKSFLPIKKYYENFVLNEDTKKLVALGWEILGFSPSTGSGSWIDMFEQSPLLYTPTSWSVAVDSVLEAGFLPRLAAYSVDNQHGITREDGSQYILKGLEMKAVGFRNADIFTHSLDEDIIIKLSKGQDVPLVDRVRMSYELAYFRPYSEWAGHGGMTYAERNVSVAALARVFGQSLDDVKKMIIKSSGTAQSMDHLFEVSSDDKVTLRENVNPAWITWQQQQVPAYIADIRIPYFGPRNAKIRVAKDTWQPIAALGQFTCDHEKETLPFETVKLVSGGTITTREVIN